MKDKFIKAYTENITRPGADKLLAWIESSDFFTAPASTRFHLSSPGGLLEHSLHVFERMKAICANEATITPEMCIRDRQLSLSPKKRKTR